MADMFGASGHVLAVEPCPPNVAQLQHNVRRLAAHIQVVLCAVVPHAHAQAGGDVSLSGAEGELWGLRINAYARAEERAVRVGTTFWPMLRGAASS